MYRLEREHRNREARDYPSFSSTLLDKIYRSIHDGETEHTDLRFYRETLQGKQNRGSGRSNRPKSAETADRKRIFTRKYHHDHDFVSFRSNSSCGRFSSSDTESRASSFVLPRPKPIKTGKTEKATKTESTTLFYGQITKLEGLIKSKSRAMKIYSNLKKVRQPISPGARLGNFINSLFTSTDNSKKSSKNSPSFATLDDKTKHKTEQVSTCSSASSYSRSCLSKNSPSTRERLRNGVKRRVRFYPVSEDCGPCGHERLYGEAEEETLMAVSPSREKEDEKIRRVEEMAREFLRKFHENQKKEVVSRKYSEAEDDDAGSCSSSDLFELDHLSFVGNEY